MRPEKEIRELDNWLVLVGSSGWRQFKALLAEHKEVLQQKTNAYLRDGDDRMASRSQAKCEDIDHILTLVQQKINGLKGG